MAKKPILSDVTNLLTMAATINTNSDLIETAFGNTLSLDGSLPNAMGADLDLNSFDLLNVKRIDATDFYVSGTPISTTIQESQAAAATSATNAADSASAASASAAEAALYDGPKFDTIALMEAATEVVGDTYAVVWDGDNNKHEVFQYKSASTLTANGTTVVTATGMGVGRWISQRTEYATVADLEADVRTFADGVALIAEGYPFSTVSTGAHLTLAGGQGVKHAAVGNTFHALALAPNADGVTDDKAKIDLLNQSGFVLDLGGKDYAYTGTFTASASIINGRIIDSNRTHDYRPKTPESQIIAPQGRWRADYHTGTDLKIFGGGQVMLGGFRMFGNYYRMGRTIPTGVNGYTTASAADVGDLGVETTRKLENWYAAFTCANVTDAACKFKLMPYLRVASVSASVLTLGEAGERKTLPLTATTYAWAADALNGVDCLVISEGGNFSGRVATITDSTDGTVTLDDVTGITDGDFLLPAPPGFTEYAWLCDHYMDTAEWRNIADDGRSVLATMVDHVSFPASGEVATATEYSLAGYISPLATAAVVRLNCTLSTTSLGNFTEKFWHDSSSHEIWGQYTQKEEAGNMGVQYSQIHANFSKKQSVWYITGGGLDTAVVSRTMNVRGWTVP